MLRIRILTIVVIMVFAGMLHADEETEIMKLKIGDPQLKNKTMTVLPGKIFSADKGEAISFEKMIAEMKTARIVYVGESHNSLPMHDIQHRIAQALYAGDKDLVLGLEMYDVKWQEHLNKWSLGLLTEDEFIDQAQWYVNWNFNFNYYKKIFDLAKENKKFIYGSLKPGARAKDFELAIQWLVDAGLVCRICRVSKPELPLTAFEELSIFKLYVVDLGLLSAMCDLPKAGPPQ